MTSQLLFAVNELEQVLRRSKPGRVALNLKVIDIAERNISTGFDLAMSLAGAKNVAEAVEMQSAYWRKQLGQMQAQAEEVRALLSRLNANVTEPIEPQMSLGRASSRRPLTEKSLRSRYRDLSDSPAGLGDGPTMIWPER